MRRPVLVNWQLQIDLNVAGVIPKEPDQGLMFFDNIYPLKMAMWDVRYLITRLLPSFKPPEFIPSDLPVISNDIQPLVKDGGAFLRFRYDSATTSLEEIEGKVQKHLLKDEFRPWFNPFRGVRGFLVRGSPWVEDLNRFPSQKLRVEFEGQDISEESLYALFRKYGQIVQIVPPSPTVKDLPRSAIITYFSMRSATAAKNCLHGLVQEGTKLHIHYLREAKAHLIRDWIMGHPRFSVPAAAALIAALTVIIFDPIRSWFIKNKITGAWHAEKSRFISWVKRNTIEMMIAPKKERKENIWGFAREETETKVRGWLSEGTETFIIVQGPRGSGKRELVINGILRNRANTLIIDCEDIMNQHGDAQILKTAACQVGYRPMFTSLNWISSMMDLAAQGVIGQKAGFSETLDSQLKKVLEMTAEVLRSLALAKKSKKPNAATMRDEEYLEMYPEERAVVVLDGFLNKGNDSDVVHKNLADWAALLVEANVAHVVFLTDEMSVPKMLTRFLPDRVFNSIVLGDADEEAANKYVRQKLGADINPDQLGEYTQAIKTLGGRLTDLEALAQRLSIGESPSAAVDEIVLTSVNEIMKLHFMGDSSSRAWTVEQTWTLCKLLAATDTLRYNEVLLDPSFGGNEDSLRALEQAGLITIANKDSRPSIITSGKPVYSAAFKRLVADKVFFAKQEFNRLTSASQKEAANIRKYEAELAQLATLPKRLWEVQSRTVYLLTKLQSSQMKIEQLEKEIATYQLVLKSDF